MPSLVNVQSFLKAIDLFHLELLDFKSIDYCKFIDLKVRILEILKCHIFMCGVIIFE